MYMFNAMITIELSYPPAYVTSYGCFCRRKLTIEIHKSFARNKDWLFYEARRLGRNSISALVPVPHTFRAVTWIHDSVSVHFAQSPCVCSS